jgi:hypothetical protein
MLTCGKYNNNCVLEEVLLACKHFDFLKTHKSGCTPDATVFSSMATGRNSLSVIADVASYVPCKTAAAVSPREGCPELPDLSDKPHPYANIQNKK